MKGKSRSGITANSSSGEGVDGDKIVAEDAPAVNESEPDQDYMIHQLGSKSSSSCDRLSVILWDIVRFILYHRFGGIHLGADTISLRD